MPEKNAENHETLTENYNGNLVPLHTHTSFKKMLHYGIVPIETRRSLMQMSSIFSVNHGTSLCLGIVLVKISGTYQ